MLDTLFRDCRYAIRTMGANPGATLVSILTLALGIGSTTAIFSILNAVALKPLPFKDPQALLFVHDSNPARNIPVFNHAPGNLFDVMERSRTLDLGGARFASRVLTGEQSPERVDVALATPSLFTALGVEASRGRIFSQAEGKPGANSVALLSHALWRSKFGADPGITGRKLVLDGEPFEVVGVLPERFTLLDSTATLWIPLVATPKNRADRGVHDVRVVARLRPGATVGQAAADLTAISEQLASEHPEANKGWSMAAKPLTDYMLGDIRGGLLTLMGAVLFVLLIACVNVANMLLARANARQKEMAVRSALGASSWTIVRQLLSESVILGLAGGVGGLALAWLGLKWLVRAAPANLPRIGEVALDSTVLLATMGVAALTGIVFGLAPAISANRADLNSVLRAAGRTGMSNSSRTWLRKMLVVSEVAMSLVLLTGAGLLIRSFAELGKVDPGFRPDGALSYKVSLPPKRYDGKGMIAFYQRLAEQLKSLPGVQAAGVTRDAPLGSQHPTLNFAVEGRPPLEPAAQPRGRFRFASPGYFPAIGLRLAKGRFFEETDSADSQPVALINEAAAKQYFAGQDPIGQRIKTGFDDSVYCTIVGVVGNTQFLGLDSNPGPETFYHYQQLPPSMVTFLAGTSTMVLRTSGDPASLAGAARAAVAAIDPELAVFDLRTMTDAIDKSVSQPRFRLTLMIVFGALAILLASLGLYGLLAFSVGQRTNEIGVRMALGADRSKILGMVVGEGLALALAGALIGIALSFWLAQFLEKFLYGVKARDLATFALAPLLILAVSLVASLWPARNATRVDPLDALRSE